jgi:ribose transport system substrate-binding protein
LIAKTNGKAKVIDLAYNSQSDGIVWDDAFQATMKTCSACTVYTVPLSLKQFTPIGIKSLFQSAYLKHQDANAVASFAAVVFELGLGAAAEATGKNLITAAGVGSEPSAMDLVRSGGLTVLAASDLTWAGWAGLDTLNRTFASEPAVPEGVGFRLVTKSSAGGSGAYKSPVDYQAGYQKLWASK